MLEATEIEAIVSDLVFVNIYCNSNPDYDSVLKGLQALNLSYEQTKKNVTKLFDKLYIHKKKSGARQISFRFENSKIIQIWSRRQNILQSRARKCARSFFDMKFEFT